LGWIFGVFPRITTITSHYFLSHHIISQMVWVGDWRFTHPVLLQRDRTKFSLTIQIRLSQEFLSITESIRNFKSALHDPCDWDWRISRQANQNCRILGWVICQLATTIGDESEMDLETSVKWTMQHPVICFQSLCRQNDFGLSGGIKERWIAFDCKKTMNRQFETKKANDATSFGKHSSVLSITSPLIRIE
jgi:hypothetical protein